MMTQEACVGFFDDLERQAAPLPDSADLQTSSAALSAVIDRLASGWVWESVLSRKPQQRSGQEVSHVEQHVRITCARDRFTVSQSQVEMKRSRTMSVNVTGERSLDREGLIELLRDQPLIARKLVLDAGGQVDPDRPDGSTVLDRDR